ncbi:MAG: flagellar biosynthetic protein FliQ [Lachnospiraceae bacterium]|jgi:flagellar biosynthetic protein FliQ|nr:flagellar biosynthetic protein FliQ [Lachnospiraceae bacterium]MCI8994171.1 flagellar biosynthetic protein FliQ [Lachnospiraceae bacterium]MCI9133497.1 flagellar biosynthetic protein FliQ [Lachnospiraceae bacterium]
MTEIEIMDIIYQAFMTALRLAMPFLLVSMIVGVIISIFQAATQINEQTLTFVPKFLAILAVMGLLGTTILNMLQDFLRQMVSLGAGG